MQSIVECYIKLLQLPHGESRLRLQPALVALRDEIACLSGQPAETIQDAFETVTEAAKRVI